MISSGKATLHEMDTVYGAEDVYDILEVVLVDAHNQNLMNKKAQAT